jgi:hypothetical protein
MDRYPLGLDNVGHGVRRVFDVADPSRACRAGLNASRFHSPVYPVVAEITLVRRMVCWMKKPHAIGARHNTISAPDAPRPIHQDHAVRCLVGSAYGAYLDAGRLFALVAELWNEKGFIDFFIGNIFELASSQVDPAVSESISCLLGGIGEDFSLVGHDISFNPGSGYVALERDLVFELACLHTETATDAFVCIYKKYPPERLWGGANGKGPDDVMQPSGQCCGDGSFDGQFKKFSPVHLLPLTRFGRLMRIMTESARKSRVVSLRVDAFDL